MHNDRERKSRLLTSAFIACVSLLSPDKSPNRNTNLVNVLANTVLV